MEKTAAEPAADPETATEAALEEAEARFHAVFDVNPAPALIIRLFDERVELVNSGFTDLTGYGREVQGRSLHELGLFVDKQAQETLLEAPRHLRQVSKAELRLAARSGDPKTVLASAKALDYNGQTCAILTFADITEQKQAEAHFTQLFHVSPVPSCLIAIGTGRFTNANRSFLELTGYNEAELLNRAGSQLGLWSGKEVRSRLQERLAKRTSFRDLELELLTKAGETRFVLAFGEVLDDDVDLLLLIMHDVTERRRTEERLRRAVQEVMDDASSFSQQVMERFVNLKPGAAHAGTVTSDLSTRERQVLGYIARGSGNDLIAAELGLAVQTVRNYVSTIYDKLGVRTRVEAAVWARERGLGDG